jgi:hypothetical protein
VNKTVFWVLAGFLSAVGLSFAIVIGQSLLRAEPSATAQAVPATIAKPTVQEAPPPPAETFPDSRRACTLKAAERLPKIPGLVIKQTRTKVLPTPANWKEETPPIRVEVDITAAGQSGTYAYLCGDSRVGTIVQPLAN